MSKFVLRFIEKRFCFDGSQGSMSGSMKFTSHEAAEEAKGILEGMKFKNDEEEVCYSNLHIIEKPDEMKLNSILDCEWVMERIKYNNENVLLITTKEEIVS